MATTVQVTLNKTEKRPLARTMKKLYTIALGYAQSARQRAPTRRCAGRRSPCPAQPNFFCPVKHNRGVTEKRLWLEN